MTLRTRQPASFAFLLFAFHAFSASPLSFSTFFFSWYDSVNAKTNAKPLSFAHFLPWSVVVRVHQILISCCFKGPTCLHAAQPRLKKSQRLSCHLKNAQTGEPRAGKVEKEDRKEKRHNLSFPVFSANNMTLLLLTITSTALRPP